MRAGVDVPEPTDPSYAAFFKQYHEHRDGKAVKEWVVDVTGDVQVVSSFRLNSATGYGNGFGYRGVFPVGIRVTAIRVVDGVDGIKHH